MPRDPKELLYQRIYYGQSITTVVYAIYVSVYVVINVAHGSVRVRHTVVGSYRVRR